MFAGFGPDVFDWFAALERDNTRDYFARTRDVFETQVRGGLEALLDELRGSGEFGGEVKVFRQHRDLRFSGDRTPYKTRTYGIVSGGRDTFYAEVSARGLYAGTGYHQMTAGQLARYRAAVDDSRAGEELASLFSAARAAGLEIEGATLKSAPRGFPRDHPRIELLRHRAVIAGRRLPPGDAGIPREAAVAFVRDTWRAAEPLLGWLDARVGRNP